MTILIPVIHYKDKEQCFRNAKCALDLGCDGVALIDMDAKGTNLADTAAHIKNWYPGKLIGVNHPGLIAKEAVLANIEHQLDFTWTDDQLTYSHWSRISKELDRKTNEDIKTIIDQHEHQLFTGVAFKYQKTEPFPWLAAERAIDFGFVPTISGIETGHAADVSYVNDIHQRMKVKTPLAIASGITPENVTGYLPFITHIFVATGISQSFYEFDPHHLETLRKLTH